MLDNYFGKSKYIEGIGNVYPITLSDYTEFKELAQKYIIIDKKKLESQIGEQIEQSRFEIVLNNIKAFEIADNESILNLIDEETRKYYIQLKESDNKLKMTEFIYLLKIILKVDKIYFDEDNIKFIIEDSLEKNEINKENFDDFTTIVMQQNLLFTEFRYDDIYLQAMLESVRRNKKEKNVEEFDLESVLQLLSIVKGKHPWEFEKYTYYQVIAEYSRFQIMESYDWTKKVKTSGFGSSDASIPKLEEKIDLNKHPESDLIKFNSQVYDKQDKMS